MYRPPCPIGSRGSQAACASAFWSLSRSSKFAALDTRRGALKATLHDFFVETNNFEQLRAAITRDRRDPHLRHDLEETLANTTTITATKLLLSIEIAAPRDVVQRLVHEVRIHHRRAVTNQAGDVVRIARDPGFHDDVGVTAQPGTHEVMMHGAGGEQRMHRQLVFIEIAIAQHQQQLAVAHRLFGLRANQVKRLRQAQAGIDIQVDELVAVLEHVGAQQLPQLSPVTAPAS